MSKEKAIKYIKAACVAIDEEPYPCTTKAKLLLVEALKELKEWKMSVLIPPEAYKRLLQGDLDWLLKQPESLEKDHIEAILKNLIKRIEEGKEF